MRPFPPLPAIPPLPAGPQPFSPPLMATAAPPRSRTILAFTPSRIARSTRTRKPSVASSPAIGTEVARPTRRKAHRACGAERLSLAQLEPVVKRAHRQLGVLRVDHARDLDLRRGDQV